MGKIVGNPAVLGIANRHLVKECIRKNPMISRPRLSLNTGLSLVTINKIVEALLQSDEIVCQGTQGSLGGRKAQHYRINEDYGITATALVGGNAIDFELRDAAGTCIAHRSCEYMGGNWTEQLLENFDSFLQAQSREKLLAVGIAVPGSASGSVTSNIPLVPEWNELDLREKVQAHFQRPTVLENDCNACAAGVYGNYEKDAKNMVFIHLGEVVGAGLVLNGSLYRSKAAFAGEFGYIPMQDGMCFEDAFIKCREQRDYGRMHELVAWIVADFSCLLDPELFVIESDMLTQTDLDEIRQDCSRILGGSCRSRLQYMSPNKSFYHEGLFSLCQKDEPDNIYIIS